MSTTASTAAPRSYSQAFQPAGAAARTARRTGHGGKRLVHFLERHAVRHRFITEFVSEGRPRCVVDAFRHLGFGEFRRRYIADSDQIEPTHELKRLLVLEVRARIGHFRMQLRKMALVLARPLRPCQLLGRAMAVAIIGQRLAVHRTALPVEQAIEGFHAVAVDQDHAADLNRGMSPVGGAPYLLGLTSEVSWSKI
jgi:hypothetical protein